MGQLHITGGIVPKGSVTVGGNKNAALPMLAASLLTREKVGPPTGFTAAG